jgi:arylamine N-acetyltransferase
MCRIIRVPNGSSSAAEAFADHFGLRPDGPGRDLLEDTCSAFSGLPYENLTKLLRKLEAGPGPQRLRLTDIVVEEYISLGAGGTCFSLTNALADILSSFGFQARPVMGDMRHGRDIHCAVLVEAPYGDYVLDPGYLVAEPVPATGGSVSVGSSTLTWVADSPGRISMFVEKGSGPEKRYELKLAEIAREEFLGHWQRSFDAPGMNSLHLCRAGGGERLYAHNSNLRIEARSGKRNVKLREDWAGSVSDAFGLDRRLAAQALAAWSDTKAPR